MTQPCHHKPLLIFATYTEAKATIDRLGATPIPHEKTFIWSEGMNPSCYTFDRGHIVLSGVGIHAAQYAAMKYAHLASEIWNMGFGGALQHLLTVGTIIPIEIVGKYIPLQERELDPISRECVHSTIPPISLDIPGYRLVSSDFPIFNSSHRSRLTASWDVVDMEGYGIAYASSYLQKKCLIWKISSDFANARGRLSIKKYKEILSEQMADHIVSKLET